MIRYKYQILQDNIPIAELPVTQGTIDCNSESVIKRSLRIETEDLFGYDSDGNKVNLDIFTHKIKVVGEEFELFKPTWQYYMDMNKSWNELAAIYGTWEKMMKPYEIDHSVSWGIFNPATPQERFADGITTYVIDAYDNNLILNQDAVIAPLFFATGTVFTDAINTIIISAGISQASITPSNKVMLLDHVYEIGTLKLDIINMLLSEINYTSIYADTDGTLRVGPFVYPELRNAKKIYQEADNEAVISDYSREQDIFDMPNVFVALVSSPELTVPLIATHVNDNPASPLSTISRGRTITSTPYKPNDIASQADLDEYIRRKAFEAVQRFETITFNTLIDPTSGINDIIFMQVGSMQGVFEVISWSADLMPGGRMNKNARKAVVAW